MRIDSNSNSRPALEGASSIWRPLCRDIIGTKSEQAQQTATPHRPFRLGSIPATACGANADAAAAILVVLFLCYHLRLSLRRAQAPHHRIEAMESVSNSIEALQRGRQTGR